MNIKIVSIAVSATLALSLLQASADDKAFDASKLPPVSTATGVTFAKDIKPIFETSCNKCHSAENPKGKLNLETLDAALAGGKGGKDIIPGKSAESPLVYAVAHVGDDDQDFMPKKKKDFKPDPLTPKQVGLIRAWIDQGAK